MLLIPYWVVTEPELLFQKFKMLQDVAVNESQKDARLQGCTQWSLCKEEMLEEKTDPASLDSEARNKMKNWKSKMEIHEK